MPRLSTTARLALLSTLLVFLCNLIMLGLLYDQLRDDAVDRLRDQVVVQARDLEAAYRSGGQAALHQAIDDLRQGNDPSLVVGLYDAGGRPIIRVGALPHLARKPVPVAFTLARLGGRQDGEPRETAYTLHRVGDLWLLSGRVADYRQQMQRTLERTMAYAALLSVVLGFLGSAVIVFYVSRRLRVIASVVDSVGAGNLSHRATVIAGGDAFDALAARVNMMLDRIARLLDELRLLTEGFAHDLRSPLARLRARVERASAVAEGPVAVAAMEGALAEADLLMRMLTTLLQISRAEALPGTGDFPPMRPADLLAEIADLYEPMAQDAGIAFALSIDADVPPIPLHRELLSQAISNLLDNALRYGGGKVVLRLSMRHEDDRAWAVLGVEDDGPGIPPDSRADALRRFVRLDSARSSPGAGLGLALVDAAARMHRGRLLLEDAGPGLAARMMLPLD